jgi:hypothetical protein
MKGKGKNIESEIDVERGRGVWRRRGKEGGE